MRAILAIMTKAEMIARYGQEYYEAHLARSRAKANASYVPRPKEPQSLDEKRAKKAAYMRQWYAAKNDGDVRPIAKRGLVGVADGTYQQQYNQLPDIKAKRRERAKADYQALSAEERKTLRAARYAARKAKLAADPAFAEAANAKQRERWARWNEAHPGLQNQRSREWIKAHPEYRAARDFARRALGKVDPEFVQFLWHSNCLDCGAAPETSRFGHSEVGHMIPVLHGGTNHPTNLIAQCHRCNLKQKRGSGVHPRFAMVNYPEAVAYAMAYEAA